LLAASKVEYLMLQVWRDVVCGSRFIVYLLDGIRRGRSRYASSFISWYLKLKSSRWFKRLNIRFWHIYPSSPTVDTAPVNVVGAGPPSLFGSLHSMLSYAIPALLIQSFDVLRDLAARNVPMPNICVVPLAWWTAGAKAKGPKVVMCVKLWHVQQLVGRQIATASSQGVLRPSICIVPVVRRELPEVGVYMVGRREREGTRG
jgi:hypothetical protein